MNNYLHPLILQSYNHYLCDDFNKIMDYQKELFSLADRQYAAFQAKLTPSIDPDLFIGVRVPQVRSLAKELVKDSVHDVFFGTLPHKYYDENMLHGVMISLIKDYDRCIELTDAFLPYVDNWAVCDIMSPKVFARHKEQLIVKIREWAASDHTYTCRFGLEMLMTHFLDADFKPEYLDLVCAARSSEYYVRMMVAWFIATALAKQWNATIGIIEGRVLDPWTHNKAIQKAIESNRITPEQKDYLRSLKV